MQCTFIKANKQRCGAKCMTGAEFCFFHNPATREEHKDATVRGGNERSKPAATLPPDTPDAPLANGFDVRAFVAETLNQVRTGKLAVAVGNCLFVGAGVLLKAIEGSELERRLNALEANQNVRRSA